MWKMIKRLCGLGALASVGYGLWWAFDRRTPGRVAWEAQPVPGTIADEPTTEPRTEPAPEPRTPAWVESADDGSCPLTHPVKSKQASGIFHVPGGASYARTQADRCYRSADAAITDGLRAAKR